MGTEKSWPLTFLIACMFAFGACGGGDDPAQVANSEQVGEESEPTATTERAEDVVDVIENGSYEECFGQAMSTLEDSSEFAELADSNANMTMAASPELIDQITAAFADCLGPVGVAEMVVAEISFGGARTPAETAPCLAERITGDEEAVVRSWFAAARQERIADDVAATTGEHYAACFPAAALVSASQPIPPLTDEERACANDTYRSSPELARYFEAQSGGPPLTEEEISEFVEPTYDCLDVPARLMSEMGGTDGLSEASLGCMTEVARSFGYFEGTVTQANFADLETGVFGCFNNEDIAVLEGRS